MSSPKENENLSFQSQFKLDKAYYKECFEESEANGLAIKPKYGLLILLVALGFFRYLWITRALPWQLSYFACRSRMLSLLLS